MEIKHKTQLHKVFVWLIGELDEHSAKNARYELDEIIDKNLSAKFFIFDFSKTSFMDSTGIGVLLGRYKKLKKMGIAPYVSNPNFSINKILQISGIYDIMPKI
ncbi:MAG: STAS domain-containing protein [Clostridiales bacterium]|nr:STAS domain-containing protein [Clostridiales bacterium]